MTQMNLSMTQTHRHREQTCGCLGEVASGGEGWIESFGLADVNYYIYRMDKQEGPIVWHRELYSISRSKLYGKRMKKIR